MILRQIRKNHQSRKVSHILKRKIMRKKVYYYPLPRCFSLKEDNCRKQMLDISSVRSEPIALNFYHVDLLCVDATIHFIQLLHKFQNLKIKSKPSKNPIVKAMLFKLFSKLEMHKRIGLSKFELKNEHPLIDTWYMCYGEDATFDEKYDEIENVLKKHLSSDDYFTINNAISEAVANVIFHAYESEEYKCWMLFVRVTDDSLTIVISDLGQTIPKTVPLRFGEQLKTYFRVSNFGKILDSELIEYATEYRRSQTNQPNRGKGFADMQAVCEQVKNATMFIYSSKGFWSSRYLEPNENEVKVQKLTYSTPVKGTIIGWQIPLQDGIIDLEVA